MAPSEPGSGRTHDQRIGRLRKIVRHQLFLYLFDSCKNCCYEDLINCLLVMEKHRDLLLVMFPDLNTMLLALFTGMQTN